MCWTGLINVRVIFPWFDVGEMNNQEVYLIKLKIDIWPKIKNNVLRRKDWFQHTTEKSFE